MQGWQFRQLGGVDYPEISLMDIDETANGTQVCLPAGEVLVICLVEKPTTGFTWALIQDGQPALAAVGDETVAATGPPGSSGSRRWLFEARTQGTGGIELNYRRSWETSVSPAQTFHVDVCVV